MGQPAARIGDSHVCPIVYPHPHVGGEIIERGEPTVHIEGRTAAVIGDICSCEGAPDRIIRGSPSVHFGGKPAARYGDQCYHGGRISSGCSSVLIGGTMPENFPVEQYDEVDPAARSERESVVKKFHLPSPARRNRMIKQAIDDAIELLFKKLRLLHKRDALTMQQFQQWFGRRDEEARRIIFMRIIEEVKLLKKLNESHFRIMYDKEARMNFLAQIMHCHEAHIVELGDPFWKAVRQGKDSKAGVLIHELSHFRDIGNTGDHMYEKSGCLALAKLLPHRALYNADSFEFFIES